MNSTLIGLAKHAVRDHTFEATRWTQPVLNSGLANTENDPTVVAQSLPLPELLRWIEEEVKSLIWNSLSVERSQPALEGWAQTLLRLHVLAALTGIHDAGEIELACQINPLFSEFSPDGIPSACELQRFLGGYRTLVDLLVAKVQSRAAYQ
jgi:hypothetical protein